MDFISEACEAMERLGARDVVEYADSHGVEVWEVIYKESVGEAFNAWKKNKQTC